MIIDLRCRLTTTKEAAYFAVQLKNFNIVNPAMQEGTLEAFFREIDDAGITTAVSVSGNSPGMKIGKWDLPPRTTSNDTMADLQRQYPGRFIGVAGIDAGNVFHNALQEIDRCHAMGLRCVFIEPGRSPGCDLDDGRLYPIYQKCVDLNMTLIPQTSGPIGGKNIDYANPMHLEHVAEDFPGLRIIAGHGCFPYVREMIIVACRRPNVWASPDFYMFYPGTEDWMKAVNDNLQGFQEKYLFGSAYPAVQLKPFVERFKALTWTAEALPKVLYKNALRALDLEGDPTFQSMYGLERKPSPSH